MARHFKIGENRPGSGIAWVEILWANGQQPKITFHAMWVTQHRIPQSLVPKAVDILIKHGHGNLIIEEVR